MPSIPGIIASVGCHERLLPGRFRAYVVRKFPKREKKRFEPESERYRGPIPLQSSQIVATDSSLVFRDNLGPYSMILVWFSIFVRTYNTYRLVMVKTPWSRRSNISKCLQRVLRCQPCIPVDFFGCGAPFHCSAGTKCASTIPYVLNVQTRKSQIKLNSPQIGPNDHGLCSKSK